MYVCMVCGVLLTDLLLFCYIINTELVCMYVWCVVFY
jgi:hypothetical protein